MTSSARVAGGDIQLSVDRATASAELQQLRAEVRSTFSGMSDDALKFASAQDRLDRALKASNGKITSSVRSAELNLRRVQSEATRANTSVVRSANQSSAALRKEEAAFGRLGRGALAGSGLLRGLGRSVAFASSTFLGGFGLIYAIGAAAEAATKQQEAEGQLETALKNRGQSVDDLRGRVNALVAADAQLGFGEADTTRSLTLAVTATGSLAGATRLLSVAQNVARARGTDLFTATQLLTRAFTGSGRGLKALGVQVANGTKGFAALDAVQSKYAGRAVAFANSEAGVRARLRAELERTKVTIGNELLPLENQLATAVADYLSKAENQAKIQHDVAVTAHTLGVAFKFVADNSEALKILLLELLALKMVSTVSRWAREISLFSLALRASSTASREAAAAGGIASAETAIAQTGGAAVVARTEVMALRASLLGLGALAIAPIVIPIVVHYMQDFSDWLGKTGIGNALGLGNTPLPSGVTFNEAAQALSDYKAGVTISKQERAVLAALAAQKGMSLAQAFPGLNGPLPNTTAVTNAITGGSPTPTPKPGAPPPPSLDRYSKIQLAIQTAETGVSRGDKGAQEKLLAALRDEIAYDQTYERKQEALIKSDPKNAKQHAETLKRLYAEEASARDQIQQINDAAAAAKKAAADKAAAAARKQAEDAKRRAAAIRAAHLAVLATTLGGIEARITKAETAETGATTLAKLKLAEARQRKAQQDLIAFYVKESHDAQLTAQQRATAVKNAAKARQDLQKMTVDDKAAELKFAVDTAETAVLAAEVGTTAYAKAIAAEKKALQAEIAYYKARAARRGVTLAEKRKDVAEELAAQKQLAALDKKTADKVGTAAQNEAQFLSSIQQIIGAYAPNAYPVAPASGGKTETHLYNVVNELRQQTPVLRRIAGRSSFPSSAYLTASVGVAGE